MNTNKDTELRSAVELATNMLSLDGKIVTPCSEASHVGILRSVDGNGPNISARLTAHRRAVFSVLHSGLARGHRANPAASLRVESVYGASVLLSGLATLVLTTKEENMLGHHYKVHVQRLLKLHQATPAPAVFLIAGVLPFPGQLHLRMFSLFGQLCRLREGNNILANHAYNIYSSL